MQPLFCTLISPDFAFRIQENWFSTCFRHFAALTDADNTNGNRQIGLEKHSSVPLAVFNTGTYDQR